MLSRLKNYLIDAFLFALSMLHLLLNLLLDAAFLIQLIAERISVMALKYANYTNFYAFITMDNPKRAYKCVHVQMRPKHLSE